MARWEPSTIDEVRERADIVEVIGEHVRLKRAGPRELRGLCPFHSERTPSFYVNADKGVFICRGCGASGSIFDFLRLSDGLGFQEAVEVLAHRYGVELRETSGERRRESPRSRLVAMHETAVDLYAKQLASRNGAEAREYLASRDITPDLVERYRIGFGGWARDGLVRALVRQAYTAEELVTGGLATREGRGLRDSFYGRVLFPIFDASDKPIGFGGRVLPDAHRREGAPDAPKYLNSRESPLFKKSRILYGTNWARADVIRAKRLVVVEGYTDVIAMHVAGVGETTATCGTSLTEQHMHEISRRFGDVRVVLCWDADAAGQAAVGRERTEELAQAYAPGESTAGGWLPVGRGWLPEVYVARLPRGLDPADFARASGAAGVAEVLEDAVPLVRFLLRTALGTDRPVTPESRATAVRRGVDVLAQVGDSLLRHEYALWLADRAGVEAAEVVRAVTERVQRPASLRAPSREAAAPVASQPLTGPQRVEREALRALLGDASLLDDAASEEDFTHPVHRALYRLMRAEWEETGRVDAARLVERVQDDVLRRTAAELSVGEAPDGDASREMLVRLKGFTVAREIDALKLQLRSTDAEREAEAYDTLFVRLLQLENRKRALREGL